MSFYTPVPSDSQTVDAMQMRFHDPDGNLDNEFKQTLSELIDLYQRNIYSKSQLKKRGLKPLSESYCENEIMLIFFSEAGVSYSIPPMIRTNEYEGQIYQFEFFTCNEDGEKYAELVSKFITYVSNLISLFERKLKELPADKRLEDDYRSLTFSVFGGLPQAVLTKMILDTRNFIEKIRPQICYQKPFRPLAESNN